MWTLWLDEWQAGHKCQLERPLIREEVSHDAKRPAIQLVSSETAIPACHIFRDSWIGLRQVSTSVAKGSSLFIEGSVHQQVDR
jgi:hypothetical protein